MICQAPCQLLMGPKVVYRATHPVVPISFILPSSHIDHLSLNDFLGLGHLLDNQAAACSSRSARMGYSFPDKSSA